MKKLISIFACVCLVLTAMIVPTFAAGTSATITFDNTSKRTVANDNQQVWVENGITVTNDKGASSSNVNTSYYNPVRFYKDSSVTIEFTSAMAQIDVVANTATYAGNLASSITGATAIANGSVVTIVLATPSTSFTFACSAGQVRVNSITVNTEVTGNSGGGGSAFDPTGKTSSEIIDAAYQLTGSGTIDNATVTGKVVSIDTPYDSGYKNITVTISVEGTDKTIKCYRLSAEDADLATLAGLAIDDTITVKGNIVLYNNTPQFAQGTKMIDHVSGGGSAPVAPSDPKQIVDEAYALADGESLPYIATLTGKIDTIDDPYSDEFQNITLTIKVEGKEDKPIVCYRLKAAEGADGSVLVEGDVITVTGTLKNYGGTIEFVSSTFVMGAPDNGAGSGTGTGTGTGTGSDTGAGTGTGTGTDTGAGETDKGTTSPATGDSFVVFAVMALVAAAVVVFATKKVRA